MTEIFHDNFAFYRNDGLSPTSLADVPRATSPVLGPPESSRSRALVSHAGLAIRQPPCYITWDIAANPSIGTITNKVNCVICNYHRLNVIRSDVSIQQNCQEARQELCRNFGAVDRSVELWQLIKLSNRNHKCGPQREAILLTHRQVFPFNIIIMYMRTKYTRLLSISSQSSFPWCKNYGPRTVPILCRCQQHRSDYNPVLYMTSGCIGVFPRGTRWYNYIILWHIARGQNCVGMGWNRTDASNTSLIMSDSGTLWMSLK